MSCMLEMLQNEIESSLGIARIGRRGRAGRYERETSFEKGQDVGKNLATKSENGNENGKAE